VRLALAQINPIVGDLDGNAGLIAGRLAEECGVGRRSHVADFARASSRLTLIFVVHEIRVARAGAKRAVR